MFSQQFDDALVFAHTLHRTQRRKTSGAPYVSHLLAVAALVIEDGGSEEEAIAALLHDALEDQSRNYPGGAEALAAEIGERFGGEVLRIVEACTERRSSAEVRITDKRDRWRAHKLGYIEQIVRADAAVRRVSTADSVHNVRSMIRDYDRFGAAIWTKFMTKSAEDQVWAYDAIATALAASGGGALAAELRRSVDELARIVHAARAA